MKSTRRTFTRNFPKATVAIAGLVLVLLFPSLCKSQHRHQPASENNIASLKYIGETIIPFNQNFKGTTVGGLSGIDYDPKNEIYYLISDDRSAINPVRYYTAKIYISEKGIDSVRFLSVQSLLQSDGQIYPSAKQDLSHTTDPEAIRYYAPANKIVWTSEGERVIKPDQTVLINPSINISTLDGRSDGTFPIPKNLTMQTSEIGPRRNGALEGISFDPDFKILYTSMEEPLYEDGPPADVINTNSWTRIYGYEVATKTNVVQYAYPLGPVAYPPNPEGAFKVNGISEILSLGNKKLLTVERSFSTGRLTCTIKVFVADLTQASAIEQVSSLKVNPPAVPIQKKLLLNMDDLGIMTDNIEGITFGPNLPNGHKTLLFVSDNNFAAYEKMQLLLFEIIP